MKKVAKVLAMAASVSLVAVMLSGCNTVAGFGKDMKKGGQDLTKAATKAKDGKKKSSSTATKSTTVTHSNAQPSSSK